MDKEKQDVIKLICKDCSYKFKFKKLSRVQPSCPYCGGSNIMKDDITAEKLVQEVSQYGEV